MMWRSFSYVGVCSMYIQSIVVYIARDICMAPASRAYNLYFRIGLALQLCLHTIGILYAQLL